MSKQSQGCAVGGQLTSAHKVNTHLPQIFAANLVYRCTVMYLYTHCSSIKRVLGERIIMLWSSMSSNFLRCTLHNNTDNIGSFFGGGQGGCMAHLSAQAKTSSFALTQQESSRLSQCSVFALYAAVSDLVYIPDWRSGSFGFFRRWRASVGRERGLISPCRPDADRDAAGREWSPGGGGLVRVQQRCVPLCARAWGII